MEWNNGCGAGNSAEGIGCLFSCLTDMSRPKALPDALPASRRTPHIGEV
jgi:hypothetical protein